MREKPSNPRSGAIRFTRSGAIRFTWRIVRLWRGFVEDPTAQTLPLKHTNPFLGEESDFPREYARGYLEQLLEEHEKEKA